MNQLPLRGVMAPGFIALALAAGVLDLWRDRPLFLWLSILFMLLALIFARDTGRLIANTFNDWPGND